MKTAAVLLALLCGHAQAACLWSDPGAHRFVGDPVAAVLSYGDIPPKAKADLAEAVRTHAYSEQVEITRDSIGGGKYTHMRAMHWGEGQQCMGPVDRSTWAANHVERGLVYCVRGHCIIVPSVCGNVARVNMAGVRPMPDPEPGKRLARVSEPVNRVPEPSTIGLVLLALAGVIGLRVRA